MYIHRDINEFFVKVNFKNPPIYGNRQLIG